MSLTTTSPQISAKKASMIITQVPTAAVGSLVKCGRGFDAGPPQVWAGSLSFCDWAVVSRLLHGAGAWLTLSPAQSRKVQGQYMRPLRRIAGHDAPPAEGGRWPTAIETLVVTGQAPVQAHIAAARLRMAGRILLRGTPPIQGLPQSWTGAS